MLSWAERKKIAPYESRERKGEKKWKESPEESSVNPTGGQRVLSVCRVRKKDVKKEPGEVCTRFRDGGRGKKKF